MEYIIQEKYCVAREQAEGVYQQIAPFLGLQQIVLDFQNVTLVTPVFLNNLWIRIGIDGIDKLLFKNTTPLATKLILSTSTNFRRYVSDGQFRSAVDNLSEQEE